MAEPIKFLEWLNSLDEATTLGDNDVYLVIDNTTDALNPVTKKITKSKLVELLSLEESGLFPVTAKTSSFSVDVSKKNGYILSASTGTITVGSGGLAAFNERFLRIVPTHLHREPNVYKSYGNLQDRSVLDDFIMCPIENTEGVV